MISIHLKIQAVKYEIYRDSFNLSARDKINSVWIYETDFIMDRILNDMSLGDIWKFLLNMFNLYSWEFKEIRSSEYFNGSVMSCLYFKSNPIIVSPNNIAISLPAKLRKKYFIMNPWDWYYKINPDLYFDDEQNEQSV